MIKTGNVAHGWHLPAYPLHFVNQIRQTLSAMNCHKVVGLELTNRLIVLKSK